MAMKPLSLHSLDFSTPNTYIICQIWTLGVEVICKTLWANRGLPFGMVIGQKTKSSRQLGTTRAPTQPLPPLFYAAASKAI